MATKAETTRVSRRAILDAAAKHFSARGFRGTPLAAIAETVGMTQAGVLYHFGSKEKLLIAVLDDKNTRDGALASEFLSGDAVGLVEGLVGIVERDQELAGMSALFTALLVEGLDRESVVHEMLVDRYRQGRQIFAEKLRAGQEQGVLDPEMDPEAKATEFLAFLDGVRDQWLLDPECVDPIAVAGQYVEHQLRALRRPSTRKRR